MMAIRSCAIGCFLVLVSCVQGFPMRNLPTGIASKTSSTQRSATSVPSLIVFDLDNTLWTPELYQLRRHQRANQVPVAGKDVQLFPGAQSILESIRKGDFPHTQFAVASRTQSVDWAHDLLTQFGLRDVFQYIEIFPGNKRSHFQNLASQTGIPFEKMLFFDDARDGKYGNCEPVSEMGVLSVHCPAGLEETSIFELGLQRFREWDGAPGTIVEWDGSVTTASNTNNGVSNGGAQRGIVKMVNSQKRFGFIRPGGNQKDVFFHFNDLPNGATVEKGDQLSFVATRDSRNGKIKASQIQLVKSSSRKTINGTRDKNSDNKPSISIRTFSMNLPFAALLANGYKTLETRNGTMFVPYPEGTKMLLHVGQRIYPDGDKHLDVMKSGGLTDEEIRKLKTLPPGFGKGMAVAIVELGKTFETTVQQRSEPDFQRKVAAFGADSGRMVTEIKRVQYLKRPMKLSGQGGVFKTAIDPDLIPDGWLVPQEDKYKVETQEKTPAKGTKIVYSISG